LPANCKGYEVHRVLSARDQRKAPEQELLGFLAENLAAFSRDQIINLMFVFFFFCINLSQDEVSLFT